VVSWLLSLHIKTGKEEVSGKNLMKGAEDEKVVVGVLGVSAFRRVGNFPKGVGWYPRSSSRRRRRNNWRRWRDGRTLRSFPAEGEDPGLPLPGLPHYGERNCNYYP
jgi:hypothetical protein